MKTESEDSFIWWKHGVLYQIYPRSFQDSDGDGIGDIPGIISRLDYVRSLGVAGIWFNPFYQSPMIDFGYDVSDYRNVDPLFGSGSDLKNLIDECHKRNLKVVFDLVLNHTSDQHPWFLESRSNKKNPKRDWYIWEEKPNNWESIFGGSAWELCEKTGEYYYHAFLKEQPDLNLRNPEVVAELKNLFRYYLDLGVDGFRLDAVNTYFEDNSFQDNPTKQPTLENPNVTQYKIYNYDHELNYSLLDEFQLVVAEYENRMIIGEVGREGKDENAWKNYYGSCNMRLDLVFNFDLLYGEIACSRMKKTILQWESILECKWPSYSLSSHDQIRSISRFPSNSQATEFQKSSLLGAFLLMIRGTPFLYYGEELGLPQLEHMANSQVRDPWAIRNHYAIKGRDGSRTPMLWNTNEHAGFSNHFPWLPIHADFQARCVVTQEQDQSSLLHFYRNLIELRNSRPELHQGKFELLESADEILFFKRTDGSEAIYICLNFSDKLVEIPNGVRVGKMLLSTSSHPSKISPFALLIFTQHAESQSS
jgi:alpha-glucosidase